MVIKSAGLGLVEEELEAVGGGGGYCILGVPIRFVHRKNLETHFPSHDTHVRSPRGGLTMGRTAEGRSELVELADDSTSSADATIPSSPRGARLMTENHGCSCHMLRAERQWNNSQLEH